MQCATGKDAAAFGDVCEQQMLAVTIKACFMAAAQRTAAQGMQANFMRLALLQRGVSAVYRLCLRRRNGVIEQHCCAARSIGFLRMMALDDLDIEIRQQRCGGLAELFQRMDAQTEIGRLQQRNMLRSLINHVLVRALKAGGANHQRQAMIGGISERLRQMRSMGKIDQQIGLFMAQSIGGVVRKIALLLLIYVDACDGKKAVLPAKRGNFFSHTAGCA